MPDQNSSVIHKSQLSTFNLVVMILGSLFLIGVGIKFLLNTQESGINWFIIFPLGFIFLGGLIASNTLMLCSVFITKEYLVLNYPLIGRKKNIEWKSISDAGMRFITTKSSGSDYSFRTGKEVRLFSNGKNYHFTTFAIKEPEKLILEIKKRLDSNLKAKMKNEYRESEKKFWKDEDDYRNWMMKIVLPICLIILALLWILNK
ncbi:hypothetical protein ATE84_5204 [Aquimarina sp. MAR_2010_214]|uniref:hypothetical protein n=1 Tax=Aquimarina sp. MAR_2010_214 TaxID=1250026 RepID=UPI000C7134C4|nr:hypothetical protein [Aquimarina sp. MAR_2010_214]PKV53070.1 hypothetical protein ATE84_5204 [Aquimarina sp. MAR_2010_214]